MIDIQEVFERGNDLYNVARTCVMQKLDDFDNSYKVFKKTAKEFVAMHIDRLGNCFFDYKTKLVKRNSKIDIENKKIKKEYEEELRRAEEKKSEDKKIKNGSSASNVL